MQELISRYRYLLERSPFGGGACLIDRTQALLWLQTSKDPSAQTTRQVTLLELRRQGARVISELVAEAYAEMIGSPEGMGEMVHGESRTGETISLETGDILAQDIARPEHDTLVHPIDPQELQVRLEALDALNTTPMKRPVFEEDVPVAQTQVLPVSALTLRQERATQRLEIDPVLLAQTAPAAPENAATTVTLGRDVSLLIEQLNPSLGALPRPAHLEFVDGAVVVTVAATRDVRAFSRVIERAAFEKNATHVVSEVLRAAQNRAKLARARQER